MKAFFKRGTKSQIAQIRFATKFCNGSTDYEDFVTFSDKTFTTIFEAWFGEKSPQIIRPTQLKRSTIYRNLTPKFRSVRVKHKLDYKCDTRGGSGVAIDFFF